MDAERQTTEAGEKRRKPRARNSAPSAESRARHPTAERVSDIVYSDLRQAIVDMDLPPGAPILEAGLTERYRISRTPVREAVQRLAAEGLIDVVAKSGTFVSRIPLGALREALVARRALEAETAAAAARRASPSEVMQLRAIVERQRERAEAGDSPAFHRADDDFHAAVAAIGRYPGLWDMIRQIRVQVERYRRLTLPQPGRMEMVVHEHGRVVDAISRRDPETAAARMREHLEKLQLDIAVFRDLWPDHFILDIPVGDLDGL